MIDPWYVEYHEVPEGTFFYPTDKNLAIGPQHIEGKHFHEWEAAIRLYEEFDYLSLNEKYEYSGAHPEKFKMLTRIAGEEFARFANKRMIGDNGVSKPYQCQCPDLLVYKPDLSEWFYCEVKSGENLTPGQKTFFPTVRAKTGKPIYLLVFS